MSETQTSELESQEGRARPYVVLEQTTLFAAIEQTDVGEQLLDQLQAALDDVPVYTEVGRVQARNAAHARSQVARNYDAGLTPPLIAVSERMFVPAQLNVELEARVRAA